MEVYFSRVFNPIWTYPDGFTWMRALSDPEKVGLHVALTPTWSETAEFADYVLPMGHSTERHDTQSYETHAAKWLGFRQPVRRVAMEKLGRPVGDTRDANPGEVWEENELWFELSWRIDPDGSMGIRQHFESPYRPGEKVTVDEYYRWIFENRVPGLKEKAEAEGMTPLAYMRRYGVVEVADKLYRQDERPLDRRRARERRARRGGHETRGVLRKPTDDDSVPPLIGEAGAVGVQHDDGTVTAGWLTPSRKLEVYSTAMRDWGWEEHATPGYIRSHVARSEIDLDAGDLVLVPTFRLPTLIHTRSGNAKYLNEISNSHPHLAQLARRRPARRGDRGPGPAQHQHRVPGRAGLGHRGHPARRVRAQSTTWGAGACTTPRAAAGSRAWSTSPTRTGRTPGCCATRAGSSRSPPTTRTRERIWWTDPGVHQNLAFGVQPDPQSGHALLAAEGADGEGARRMTSTATSTSTPRRSDARSTGSGWPRPAPPSARAGSAGPSS